MTEKQFWAAIDKTLSKHIADSEKSGEDFLRKFVKLLINKADELLKLEPAARKKFLRRLFIAAGYADYWAEVQAGFDSLLEFQNKFWEANTTAGVLVNRNNARLLALEAVRFQKFGELGKSGVASLEKAFAKAVKENLSKKELIANLDAIGGKVGKYSIAIADTSLRGWDRSVTAIKAELAGIKKATFDGPPLIPNSHNYCIDNYKKTRTIEEWDASSNGQLDPVRVYAGGYRCRHRLRYHVRKILK